MGAEAEKAAAISFIRGMVACLGRQYELTPRYRDMLRWYTRYYEDGDVAECLKTAGPLKRRHRLYAECLVKHRFHRLHSMQRLFQLAAKMRGL